ncbi:hypothetical protein D3C81_2227670 [compost metagenome]
MLSGLGTRLARGSFGLALEGPAFVAGGTGGAVDAARDALGSANVTVFEEEPVEEGVGPRRDTLSEFRPGSTDGVTLVADVWG